MIGGSKKKNLDHAFEKDLPKMRVKKDSLKLMHKVKKKMTEESKYVSSNDIKISNLSI
jgi:hypothetical protein